MNLPDANQERPDSNWLKRFLDARVSAETASIVVVASFGLALGGLVTLTRLSSDRPAPVVVLGAPSLAVALPPPTAPTVLASPVAPSMPTARTVATGSAPRRAASTRRPAAARPGTTPSVDPFDAQGALDIPLEGGPARPARTRRHAANTPVRIP